MNSEWLQTIAQLFMPKTEFGLPKEAPIHFQVLIKSMPFLRNGDLKISHLYFLNVKQLQLTIEQDFLLIISLKQIKYQSIPVQTNETKIIDSNTMDFRSGHGFATATDLTNFNSQSNKLK